VAGISAEEFSVSVQQMLQQGRVYTWAACYQLPPTRLQKGPAVPAAWTASCVSPASETARGISADTFSASVQQMLLQHHIWAPCFRLPPTQQQMRPAAGLAARIAAAAWKLLQLLPTAAASAPVKDIMQPIWPQGVFLTPQMAQLLNSYGEQQQQHTLRICDILDKVMIACMLNTWYTAGSCSLD
jgi:hypothetical protein